MYRENGAEIADTAGEVFAQSDLVVKVKEPQAEEFHSCGAGQVLFTYLQFRGQRNVDSQCARNRGDGGRLRDAARQKGGTCRV